MLLEHPGASNVYDALYARWPRSLYLGCRVLQTRRNKYHASGRGEIYYDANRAKINGLKPAAMRECTEREGFLSLQFLRSHAMHEERKHRRLSVCALVSSQERRVPVVQGINCRKTICQSPVVLLTRFSLGFGCPCFCKKFRMFWFFWNGDGFLLQKRIVGLPGPIPPCDPAVPCASLTLLW